MSGEDTGLGSADPPLVGYLGKVQERSASLENCPWCAAKGLTCVLRSYRINLRESITLCTAPQCLFPLVSRPLEDVLASLVSPEAQLGAKSKTPQAPEREDLVPSKRSSSKEERDEDGSLQNGSPISQPQPTKMEVSDNHRGPLSESEDLVPSKSRKRSRCLSSEEEEDDEGASLQSGKRISQPQPTRMEVSDNHRGSLSESEDLVPSKSRKRSKRLSSEEEESDEDASLQNGDHIGQPQPTKMDCGPLPENGRANGYHKDSDWPVPEEMDQEVVQGDEAPGAIPEEVVSSPESVRLDNRPRPLRQPVPDPLAPVPIVISSGCDSDSEVEYICLQKPASGVAKNSTAATDVPTLKDESDLEVVVLCSQNSPGSAKAVTSSITTPAVSITENNDPLSAEANFSSEAVVQSESGRLAVSSSEVRAEGGAEPLCRPCSVDLSQSRLDGLEPLAEPAEEPTPRTTTRWRSSRNTEETVEDVILEDDEQRDGGGCIGREITKISPSVDTLIGSKELVQVSPYLFWRNTSNLSWLDSLLVAMVNCRTLKETRPQSNKSRRSVVWELCTIYKKCCGLIAEFSQGLCKPLRQSLGWDPRISLPSLAFHVCLPLLRDSLVFPCPDGIIKVPVSVLQMVTKELEALRMFVLNRLQPKLQKGFCPASKEDTLAFVFPFLIKLDSWAELNFSAAIDWTCVSCSKPFRIKRSLTSLKKVGSDWNPLKSTIKGKCSGCNKYRQDKKLVMESVSPVIALHFEQGLPDTQVGKYSFNFNQYHYLVTTVIQYCKENKHFVTWIRKPSGLWLEFDDLKHPDCVSHRDLSIPAQDAHIVFWERGEEGEKFHSRSLSDSVETDYAVPIRKRCLEAKDFMADEPDESVESGDLSIRIPHDDTGIVAALTTSDAGDSADKAVDVDASIGSTTLLDTFEGLSHDDIVTLTLVEVTDDSTGKPSKGDAPASPPAPKIRRVSSKSSRKPATPSQPGELILPSVVSSACQVKSPSGETEQASPLSSTPALKPSSPGALWQRQGDLSPSSIQPHLSPSLTKPSTLATNTSTPSGQTKPQRSNPSSLTQRPQPLRPQRDLENKVLPLKAAEMYGGFCARNINNPYQTLFPAKGPTQNVVPSKVPFTPAIPNPPKPPVKPMVASMTSLPVRGVTEHLQIPKKPSSHQTRVPSEIPDTGSLRLKLLKKLKAKKKKLEKLNKVLGHQGSLGVGSTLKPDSTVLESYAVSSSTSVYDSPTYDEFFADLLSPETTASNLSPDSTGFMEPLISGKEGGGDTTNGEGAIGGAYQIAVSQQAFGDAPMTITNDNFLEEFISGTSLAPNEMQTDAIDALDLFF